MIGVFEGLIRFPLCLGASFGAGVASRSGTWGLATKLSRSRGNLLSRAGSLGLGGWGLDENDGTLPRGLEPQLGAMPAYLTPRGPAFLLPLLSEIWRSREGIEPWLTPMGSVARRVGVSTSEWKTLPCEENFFRAGLARCWGLYSLNPMGLWGGLASELTLVVPW